MMLTLTLTLLDFGDQCLPQSVCHLHVFGSYSWEPLFSHWLASRSWLERDLVQSYLNRSLGWPDLLPSQQGLEKVTDCVGSMVWSQICWCKKDSTCWNNMNVLVFILLNGAFSRFSQKHLSENPKIKNQCSALTLKEGLKFYNKTVVLKGKLCWEKKEFVNYKPSFIYQE